MKKYGLHLRKNMVLPLGWKSEGDDKKMSENKWTREQEMAINISGCNILVAAAAGSGKTAVLVERIIRKITDEKNPIDIDRLLVVTFTNAAAAEMRERIGNAITKALDANPESRQLQRQLALLQRASIMTIHSFCLQVIRNNFHIIDIDPSFRITDETESILLKQECMEELFDDKYEKQDEGFLKLVDSYAERDDTYLEDIIFNLHRFVQSSPWPEEWLKSAAEDFNIGENFNFDNTKWAQILLDDLSIEMLGIEKAMMNAVSLVEGISGLEHYSKAFVADIENIKGFHDIKSWNEFVFKLSNTDLSKLSTKRVDDSVKEVKERAKSIRDDAKKKFDAIKNDFIGDGQKIEDGIRFMYPLLKSLSDLVIDFNERYSIKKRERGVIDFNDIEHFCLRILLEKDEEGIFRQARAAQQYIDRFEEVLVDEYQDSNLVQEEIINSIARKNDGQAMNIFMVGDVKQSIYRFRQAMPELFLGKYKEYPEEAGTLRQKIKLFKNFRSRKEVIDGANFIFSEIMSENIGELNYDESEALNLGADYEETGDDSRDIELHLIDKSSLNKSADSLDESIDTLEEEQPDSIQLEARLVGRRIKELIGSKENPFQVFDKETRTMRNAEYRDIVVLMRTTANWSQVFMDEFVKMDIPAYADTGTGYFETNEIRTVLSLLEIIDNPMQDIPLIAVLRSPIASFSAEELIDIRLVDKELSFYEALIKLADMLNSKEVNEITDENLNRTAVKTQKFLERFHVWREKSRYMSIDEFIWYLYTETGYYGYVGAMPGGSGRQANLRMLFERARAYEETSYKGLFNFITFIRKLRSSSGDLGSAKILGEDENVVRIMSIHKSKGLEFAVVFVAGMGKGFNLQDMNRNILYHVKLGFGPDFIDSKRRLTYPTIVKQALKKKIKLETLSEEMRILYVAFTRAKEKLIITGLMKSVESSLSKWCRTLSEEDKVPEYSLASARNYLDWICPAVMKHRDGKPMREAAGCGDFNIKDDPSNFDVKLWDAAELTGEAFNKEVEDIDIIKEIESANLSLSESPYKKEIDRRLGWEYRYIECSKIPAKISVSEIKRKFYEEMLDENSVLLNEPQEKVNLRKPAFMEEKKKFTPAERGTLMHLVMQVIDLSRTSSIEDIKNEIARLKIKEFITEEQSQVIDIEKIYKFFNSGLGMRMKTSGKVKREIPFYMEIASTEIYKELKNDIYDKEKILVQGVIDCYFEEDGEIVLLDYKTDYVSNAEEIKERYKLQLSYYGRALEELTGLKIKAKYLYLFYNGLIIEMD